MIEQEEIWKDIEGYENVYQVSNLGRVKSLRREYYSGRGGSNKKIAEEKILKLPIYMGYSAAGLYTNGKLKYHKVHRLVAKAFIPNPDNLPEVNHLFGDKQDNRAISLEWSTRQDNQIHSYKVLGRQNPKGADNSKSIPVYQYKATGELVKKYDCIKYAHLDGYDNRAVVRICKSGVGSIKGFIWSFTELPIEYFSDLVLVQLKSRMVIKKNGKQWRRNKFLLQPKEAQNAGT